MLQRQETNESSSLAEK